MFEVSIKSKIEILSSTVEAIIFDVRVGLPLMLANSFFYSGVLKSMKEWRQRLLKWKKWEEVLEKWIRIEDHEARDSGQIEVIEGHIHRQDDGEVEVHQDMTITIEIDQRDRIEDDLELLREEVDHVIGPGFSKWQWKDFISLKIGYLECETSFENNEKI